MKVFRLEGEKRLGVLLALAAVSRMPGLRRSWANNGYNSALADSENTLMRLLGADTQEARDAVRAELKALPRIERGAAKHAARES